MINFSAQNILSLSPSFFCIEKEIYLITSESHSFFLEIYLNSDFGVEYTLYNEKYDDIDGGVIDECEVENEQDCVRIILEVLEEMSVKGNSISKLSEEEILSVEEKVQEKWEAKVKIAKGQI